MTQSNIDEVLDIINELKQYLQTETLLPSTIERVQKLVANSFDHSQSNFPDAVHIDLDKLKEKLTKLQGDGYWRTQSEAVAELLERFTVVEMATIVLSAGLKNTRIE